MLKARSLLIGIVCASLVALTGRWDRKEIEEIGIVLGIGLDAAKDRMTMVHSLAVPKAFAAKEKGKLKNYVNVVSEGDVVFKNVRDLAASLVRYPTYEHLKVVVISEELARTFDLRKVMDFLLRNSETRRSIKVMISQNKAKDVFEPVPPLESNSALKLSELADAASQTLTIAPKLKLGEMSARLSAGTSFVMQRVTMTKQGAKLSGGAVIRGSDGKWIGWLDENAMQGLNLMLKGDKRRNGIISATDPDSGARFVYEIRELTSTITPGSRETKSPLL
ncbi:Ger(x)C family spore germination protein [Paenibacillus sp. P25]|nr:Ger(x)C family spore germination protein [Paenibacillus sp. P25]